jgi:hypothetical protein
MLLRQNLLGLFNAFTGSNISKILRRKKSEANGISITEENTEDDGYYFKSNIQDIIRLNSMIFRSSTHAYLLQTLLFSSSSLGMVLPQFTFHFLMRMAKSSSDFR